MPIGRRSLDDLSITALVREDNTEVEQMPFNPEEPRRVGNTDVFTNLLTVGTARTNGAARVDSLSASRETLDVAWKSDLRTFELSVTPNLTTTEHRLASYLGYRPRGSYSLVCTIGLLEDTSGVTALPAEDFRSPGQRGGPQVERGEMVVNEDLCQVIMDVAERSMVDRFETVSVRCPAAKTDQFCKDVYPVLQRLRVDGTVGAIGVSMSECSGMAELVRSLDLDFVNVSGRYTLLDQRARKDVLPACEETNTSIIVSGVFNSGILSNPERLSTFDGIEVDDRWRRRSEIAGVRKLDAYETGSYWLNRGQEIQKICEHFNIPLYAAALQFVAAHPLVSTMIVGVGTPMRMHQYIYALKMLVPNDLWLTLLERGYIDQNPID